MSLFAGHKRDLDDDGSQSANFKKFKSDLGALFGLGANNSLVPQHSTVVSFRELTILDDKACTALVEILKTHGYHKVKDMPPEFVNTCSNLYSSCKSFFTNDDAFKQSRFPEKETETGYRKAKDRECVFFRKGYHIDEVSSRGMLAMDPARDLHSRFEQYFSEAAKVAHVILQAVIKGLGGSPEQARNILPLTHEHSTLSTNVARAFHYSDTPVHTVICPPHHDLGLLTLIPSNFPGLQVYSLCGSCGLGWESTHKSLDATDIVVLAGECLTEFTGGALPPGLHRVVSEKPLPLAFNFPFSSSPTTPPSHSPTNTTTVTSTASGAPPPAKRGRTAKSKSAAAAQVVAQTQHEESQASRAGRISLPFLLRARGDVKLDGTLLGLRPTKNHEKTVGHFFDEERQKKAATVGQY